MTNPDAVERFADALYPHGLGSSGVEMGRADAVALLRDAKRGKNRSGEPVLIRGFSEATLLSARGELDVQRVTSLCGTACFVVSDEIEWKYTGGRVALVENLEPFLRFEECSMSSMRRFIAPDACPNGFSVGWRTQAYNVVHFGDYDPVGLQEYLRLKDRCGCKASLYVPANIHELVRRYGKPELLRDSSAIYSGLRSEQDADVARVFQCLEEFGLWPGAGSALGEYEGLIMAWRLRSSVVRGEIDNRVKGKITGKVWLAGRAEPVVLKARRQRLPRRGGLPVTFTNPVPQVADEHTDLFPSRSARSATTPHRARCAHSTFR